MLLVVILHLQSLYLASYYKSSVRFPLSSVSFYIILIITAAVVMICVSLPIN